nr:hypothetical protein [Bacteroidota bacterium]
MDKSTNRTYGNYIISLTVLLCFFFAPVSIIQAAVNGSVSIDNANPAQGTLLTATVSDIDGATGAISYQWKSNTINIPGATNQTFTTTQTEVGTTITVQATYTDDVASPESPLSAATAAVTNVNDSPTGTVTIDNASPTQGSLLTANN